MKCIIHCVEQSCKWVRESLHPVQPWLLPIGNKPYLEFLLDYCALCGVTQVRILMDEPDQTMRDRLGFGERWNFEIFYGFASVETVTPDDLEVHNRGFIGDSDVLMFNGMFWLDYDKNAVRLPKLNPGERCSRLDRNGYGWCLRCSQGEPKEVEVSPDEGPRVRPLSGIKDYFELNMSLLKGEMVHYNLPGYGSTPNVLIGRNVEIPRSANIFQPLILGDSIQLGQDTTIGANVVIGDNSLIDRNTIITDSVVMGGTYIGANLELRNKIICHNVIINAGDGTVLDICDDYLCMPMKGVKRNTVSVCQRLSALILWLLMLLPYLVLRPFVRLWKSERVCLRSPIPEDRMRLKFYIHPEPGVLSRLFMRLSLDRFHLLPQVILGKLRMIGSLILEANDRNAAMLRHFPDYAPGIFSYSESLEHENDPMQMEMDELYYMYHASFSLNRQILYRIFLRNFIKRS